MDNQKKKVNRPFYLQWWFLTILVAVIVFSFFYEILTANTALYNSTHNSSSEAETGENDEVEPNEVVKTVFDSYLSAFSSDFMQDYGEKYGYFYTDDGFKVGEKDSSSDVFEFIVTDSRNWKVRFDDECSNSVIKEVLASTIRVLNNNAEQTFIDDSVSALISSFDGRKPSDTLDVGGCRIYLGPPLLYSLDGYSLFVVSLDEINIEKDTNAYKDFSAKEMSAPLNAGENAHIRGSVVFGSPNNTFPEVMYELWVQNNNGEIYIVQLLYSSFAGEIVEGETYDFYGTITSEDLSSMYTTFSNVESFKKGYIGALWLEYCEKA